jgi:hypothetical protein
MKGIGVMINELFGDNFGSAAAFKSVLSKKIKSIELSGDKIALITEDDTKIYISDEGQSCCEHRYMVCDDDLPKFAGATITDFEIAAAPDGEGGEVHEVQFFRIHTDQGIIVFSNHNEHNGCYGGFSVCARGAINPLDEEGEK